MIYICSVFGEFGMGQNKGGGQDQLKTVAAGQHDAVGRLLVSASEAVNGRLFEREEDGSRSSGATVWG